MKNIKGNLLIAIGAGFMSSILLELLLPFSNDFTMMRVWISLILGGVVAGFLYSSNAWLSGLLIGLMYSTTVVLLKFMGNTDIANDLVEKMDIIMLNTLVLMILGIIGSVIGGSMKRIYSYMRRKNA